MILNATPHPINIFRQEDCYYEGNQRKWFIKKDIEPIQVIKLSGRVLNAYTEYKILHYTGDNIPIWISDIFDIDDPLDVFDLSPGDIIIVSRMYAEAHRKWIGKKPVSYKLACICQPVYDNTNNPRAIGCLGLEIV